MLLQTRLNAFVSTFVYSQGSPENVSYMLENQIAQAQFPNVSDKKPWTFNGSQWFFG